MNSTGIGKPTLANDHGSPTEVTSPTTAIVPRHESGARKVPILAAVTLGVIVITDWLFWQQPRGWTIGAYGLLLTGVLLACERRLPRRLPPLIITAALLALLLQCFEEPGSLTLALSVLGLFTLALILREGWSASTVDWIRRWALLARIGWQKPFRDALAWHRAQFADGDVARPAARFLRRWSVPLLLAVAFFVLFAVANPVISMWLWDAWHSLREPAHWLLDRFPTGRRVLMWAVTGVSVWALLRFHSGAGAGRPAAGWVAATAWPAQPSPAFVVRCLVLFNALFALQSMLDIRYLWGGAELPEGLTYARYAHRGAYPLVAAAIFAAIFVFVTFRAGSHEHPMRWARRLVYLWLAQNLLLVISAAWRLRLYVEAYSLTRLRVAAALWMLLVLCGLVWILVRIISRRSTLWLLNINTATAMTVLYACAFINFDGGIASFNVAHCREVLGFGQPIDLPYLEHLGPEALPALMYLAERSNDPTALPEAHAIIGRLRAEVRADLGSWRGWTWRRQRLAQVAFAAFRDTGATD